MGAYDYERPTIDGGSGHSTEQLDWLATIGFYLKQLPKHHYAILYYTYHDTMPAHAVVKRIKEAFPQMLINHGILEETRHKVERRLWHLFCDVEIIERDILF